MPELLYTHRRMREKIFEARTAVALLLGIKEITWPDNDYALFTVMNEMWLASRKSNPTIDQVKVFTGAWMRFLNRLINELPESNLKSTSVTEFEKMARGYEEFLGAKTDEKA
jgi:hypothetical protein